MTIHTATRSPTELHRVLCAESDTRIGGFAVFVPANRVGTLH